MRFVWILFCFLAFDYASIHGQSLDVDLLDPDRLLDPESLWEDQFEAPSWLPNDSLKALVKNNAFPRSFRSQSLMSSSWSESNLPVWRFRSKIQSSGIEMGILAQDRHQSGGLIIHPLGKKLSLVLGDFHFDYGFGLLFSTRQLFGSWSQDPVNQIYKARGLRINTSSDTSRFLRGGGLSYSLNRLRVTGLFSDRSSAERENRVQGLFLSWEDFNLQLGIGYVLVEEFDSSTPKWGVHFKYGLRGGIFFGEIKFDSSFIPLGESGLCWFANPRNRFLFVGRVGLPGQSARYSKIKALDSELGFRQIELNYQGEWRRGRSIHLNLYSRERMLLPQVNASMLPDWGLRMGLRLEYEQKADLDLKLACNGEGLKALGRVRFPFKDHAGFFQAEWGSSAEWGRNLSVNRKSYFAMDWQQHFIQRSLSVKGGCCISSGNPGGILLYRYEPDLYYQMSLPVISGTGFRGYFSLRYEIGPRLVVETKLNRTIPLGQKLGSPGTSFKIQLIYRPVFGVEN